jgi:2C-methyl-D-erythritol 2,4-cyclodiphosphate synthase
MSPYIDEMRTVISELLDTDIENISIKATTTESLGFEGEGSGISAKAVCILVRNTMGK